MGCVAALGSVNPFTYTSRYFGSGDGSCVLFNLAGMDSNRAYLMPVLFKQDWGGIQQLYTTPRTNYLYQSQNQSSATYSLGTMTVTGGIADPVGGTGAFTLTASGAGSTFYQFRPASLTPGTYCNSVWVRRRTGVGMVSLYTPAFIGSAPLALTASYQRLSVAGNTTGDFVWGVYISMSGDAVDIAFGQSEPGSVMTAYIPTTTAAVTVTDYSVDATGKVTTSPALPPNTILSYRDPFAPSGNVYRAFGIGDGVSTDFSLPFVPAVPVLYQTDWQGTTTLVTTPRTNLALQSDSAMSVFEAISGTGVAPIITLNYAAPPSGVGITATRVILDIGVGTTASDYAIVDSATFTDTAGLQRTRGLWIKSNTAASYVLTISSYAGLPPTQVTVTPVWQKFTATAISSADARVRLYIVGNDGSSKFVDISTAALQYEAGSIATAYIPTVAAAVTVTDYTYTPNGDVAMAVAPAVGAILTADMNFGSQP